MILLLTLLALVGVVAFAAASFLGSTQNRRGDETLAFRFRPIFVVPLIASIAALVLIPSSIVTVDEGTRGVVTRFGAVTNKVLEPGLQVKTPFIDSVVSMNVKTLKYESAETAASRDLQSTTTEVTLNWSLAPDRVVEVFSEFRGAHESTVVVNAVSEAVKQVTARYAAEELVQKRDLVKADIEEVLSTRLAEKGMIVENVALTDFSFSAVFNNAIEAKEEARQNALRAENEVALREAEARQREAEALGRANAAIEEARGQKEATILAAEGEAARINTVAQANADAIRQINQALSEGDAETLIRYNLVDQLADDINTIILPSGQEFILGDTVLK